MKIKIILQTSVLLLFSVAAFSQLQKEVQHPDIAGRLFHNPLKGKQTVLGSQYSQNTFVAAKVSNITSPAWMRYNVFHDEFEFITQKNDTLILDKIDDFGAIVFTGTHKTYNLLQYTDRNNKLTYGYLINVSEKNGYTLYKKENIGFVEEKIAKTTLEVNMPAKFVKSGDTYFLKNKDLGTSEFPSGKKALVKLFPDHKPAIENFLKENKISFSDESDMVKIMEFLASM